MNSKSPSNFFFLADTTDANNTKVNTNHKQFIFEEYMLLRFLSRNHSSTIVFHQILPTNFFKQFIKITTKISHKFATIQIEIDLCFDSLKLSVYSLYYNDRFQVCRSLSRFYFLRLLFNFIPFIFCYELSTNC